MLICVENDRHYVDQLTIGDQSIKQIKSKTKVKLSC